MNGMDLTAWADKHGITATIELLDRCDDLTQVTGISETWLAKIVTPNGEIGVRTTTDGSYTPLPLDQLFAAWEYERPEAGEIAACLDVLGPEATMELITLAVGVQMSVA